MRALVITAGILVLIVGGFALSALLGGGDDSESKDEISEVVESTDNAPRFALPDYTGKERASSEFQEKIQVINLWSTWCPFCVDELPDFAALHEEFEDEIVVIAINRGESRNDAKEFTDQIGIGNRITLLLDANESYYRAIGGFAMPETLFVRSDGTIHLHKRGPLSLSEMRTVINQMLP